MDFLRLLRVDSCHSFGVKKQVTIKVMSSKSTPEYECICCTQFRACGTLGVSVRDPKIVSVLEKPMQPQLEVSRSYITSFFP